MKLLIASGIYPPESGGPATYSYALSKALTALGHEVSVVSYGESEGQVSRSGGPFIRYIRFFWRVFALAKQVDVIFLQGAVSEGFPASVAALLRGKKTVLRLPGDYAWEMAMQQKAESRMKNEELLDAFLEKRHSGKIGWYERLERWTAKRATFVIAPSKYLKSVAERWGVPSEHIRVIFNAEQPMNASLSREEARMHYAVEDKIVCLTAARAVPWKGVGELIEWWNELPASYVLVVAGDGLEQERWKKMAEPLGNRVRFVGRLDRDGLANWMRASDVFLLHSGYEGYPHVVAEAASLGLPCLVSDQGGNPETKEVFGDLITVLPYRDKRAWVEALNRVEQNTNRQPQKSVWTHEQMVKEVLDVLSLCR